MDSVIPRHVHRALRYIQLLNEQNVDPSRANVEKFARSRQPADPVRGNALTASFQTAFTWAREVEVVPAGAVADYLLSMEWVAEAGDPRRSIHVTNLGRALLAALDFADTSDPGLSEVLDIALEPSDALVYVNLTRVVASAGAGLLVDPYFKPEYIQWLVDTTSIRRVLVKSRHGVSGQDMQLLATALGTVPGAGAVSVRTTSSSELHDRCLLAADGRVQLIGGSINGVGKNLTAIIAPDAEIARIYRDRYEALWSTADVVSPRTLTASTVDTTAMPSVSTGAEESDSTAV